jgi:hypothetical protein
MKKSRTTLPLDEQDREALEAIREYYGVHSDADAIRIALRETLRAIRRQPPSQAPNKEGPSSP